MFCFFFAIIICLIITPINLKIINPIEKTLGIPESFEMHDLKCTGFGITFSFCKELETTHLEKSRPITLFVIYSLEAILTAICGYYLNNFIIKKLSWNSLIYFFFSAIIDISNFFDIFSRVRDV